MRPGRRRVLWLLAAIVLAAALAAGALYARSGEEKADADRGAVAGAQADTPGAPQEGDADAADGDREKAFEQALETGKDIAATSAATLSGGSGTRPAARPMHVTFSATQPRVPESARQHDETDDADSLPPITPADPSAVVRHAAPTAAQAAPRQLGQVGPDTPQADGDFTFFRNTDVASGTSQIAEPSVASNGTAILETYNWGAARSLDGGRTFTYMNPYTSFPADDGGFCCDQLAWYDPGHDIFIWVLQYVQGSNGNNRIRVAVTNGAAGLASGNWWYWDFTAQDLGAPSGQWFDQPKIATTSNSLYLEISHYNNANPAQWQGSQVIEMPLANLAARTGFGYQWLNSTVFSPGLAQGASGTMYFAGHVNTSTLRVWAWPDNTPWQSATVRDYGHTSYPANYPYSCPRSGGPSTANFCNRESDRINSGWVRSGLVGFTWNASQGTAGFGTFNYPYVHIVQINPSTQTVVQDGPIYNQSAAWAYGSLAPNARGDVGGTFVYGGGSSGAYEHCVAGIDDGYTAGTNFDFVYADTSSADVGTGSGDYLTGRVNGGTTNTWSGGCYATPSSTHAYYLSFGRAIDNPLRTLSVSRAGTGSGTVTSSPSGISCGSTCAASYTYNQTVTLTASPASGSSFAGWSGDCSGTGSCTVSMTAARSVTATFANSVRPSIVTFSQPAAAFQKKPAFAVKWSASEPGGTIASYDVRVRSAAWNGSFGSYTTWLSATTLTNKSYTGTPGNTYCFSGLARDTHGNTSPSYSPDTCTAVPLDDASLAVVSGKWTRKRGVSGYFKNTYTVSTQLNAQLQATGVRAANLALLVTKCNGCGTIQAYWNGSPLGGPISLQSSTTQKRQIVALPSLGSLVTGTFSLKVTTSGKQVQIDGLGVSAV